MEIEREREREGKKTNKNNWWRVSIIGLVVHRSWVSF